MKFPAMLSTFTLWKWHFRTDILGGGVGTELKEEAHRAFSQTTHTHTLSRGVKYEKKPLIVELQLLQSRLLLAWPCFLGSKRYRKLEGLGEEGEEGGGRRVVVVEEEAEEVGGKHSGRGGVTSKPTSKGINNCFCWFCCCDTDRRSSKWRAGSFDLRQPSWRGLLLSAAD